MDKVLTAENPYAGQGAVLLDIGDDIGALVVTMPAALDEAEVEIRPLDQHAHSFNEGSSEEHAHERGTGTSRDTATIPMWRWCPDPSSTRGSRRWSSPSCARGRTSSISGPQDRSNWS